MNLAPFAEQAPALCVLVLLVFWFLRFVSKRDEDARARDETFTSTIREIEVSRASRDLEFQARLHELNRTNDKVADAMDDLTEAIKRSPRLGRWGPKTNGPAKPRIRLDSEEPTEE